MWTTIQRHKKDPSVCSDDLTHLNHILASLALNYRAHPLIDTQCQQLFRISNPYKKIIWNTERVNYHLYGPLIQSMFHSIHHLRMTYKCVLCSKQSGNVNT